MTMLVWLCVVPALAFRAATTAPRRFVSAASVAVPTEMEPATLSMAPDRYVATTRFVVGKDEATEFEQTWARRSSKIGESKGPERQRLANSGGGWNLMPSAFRFAPLLS